VPVTGREVQGLCTSICTSRRRGGYRHSRQVRGLARASGRGGGGVVAGLG
jgi:hypothetical protein